MVITQNDAQSLIQMDKERVDDQKYLFPSLTRTTAIPLLSFDGKEEFSLDIHECQIRLAKLTLQNRARVTIILIRLDLAGPPHMNPDGQFITGPHIHIYREGFGDRFAEPLPATFINPQDKYQTLQDFLKYCHVTKPPIFDKGMWQ